MWQQTELSVLSQQCLNRRIAKIEQLTQEVDAWQQERNQSSAKVIWRFSTE
ncbi:MAG: IS630 family transposase, partial [Symploca sp. SIO2E6]|nr:IS630 family transposase [Symploca sp. SIO2E6]